MRLDEEAKKEAERAKVEAAVAKQEEYWANQLKKQQAKREASMSAQERRAMEQQKIVQDRNIDEMLERDIAKDVKREQIKEEERLREPKHESEILKEVSHLTNRAILYGAHAVSNNFVIFYRPKRRSCMTENSLAMPSTNQLRKSPVQFPSLQREMLQSRLL